MAHSATTGAGSRPLPPENARHLTLGVPPLQLFTLVVGALRPGERDGDLRDAVLEVQLQGNQREALWGRTTDELANLAFVEQQLARASGGRVVVAAGQIRRDAHALEPHLPVAEMCIRFNQARFPIP